MKTLCALLCFAALETAFAEPSGLKNEDGSFRVSESAKKRMGIFFMPIKGTGPWIIPASALVKIKFTSGVYRQFEGDISYVLVKVIENQGTRLLIDSQDLEDGDDVAFAGTHFLRLTEADLKSGTVDSCAH